MLPPFLTSKIETFLDQDLPPVIILCFDSEASLIWICVFGVNILE